MVLVTGLSFYKKKKKKKEEFEIPSLNECEYFSLDTEHPCDIQVFAYCRQDGILLTK